MKRVKSSQVNEANSNDGEEIRQLDRLSQNGEHMKKSRKKNHLQREREKNEKTQAKTKHYKMTWNERNETKWNEKNRI